MSFHLSFKCGPHKVFLKSYIVYKIVTKIIVARLRPFLSGLITPFQSAFILGRKGIDNAIITQELIHTISRAKGKEGYMAIKIDQEKVYDKLEWSFIRQMLFCINLPRNLIDLIMSYVSSVSTSIIFNESALEPFFPSRGIRQGDPLSPYLFIICMDFLSQLIEEKCSSNQWTPIKSSKNGLAFSHLMFADDLVLFAKANDTNCHTIRSVLNTFCSISGQLVSEAKSRVFFSPNVDRDKRDLFSDILRFRSIPSLGKYPRIPIKHAGHLNQYFNLVLDRVKQKLAG